MNGIMMTDDYFDEIFNPQTEPEPQYNDVSETRSVDNDFLRLRSLMITETADNITTKTICSEN